MSVQWCHSLLLCIQRLPRVLAESKPPQQPARIFMIFPSHSLWPFILCQASYFTRATLPIGKFFQPMEDGDILCTSNMAAVSHVWLLHPWNIASATEELSFWILFYFNLNFNSLTWLAASNGERISHPSSHFSALYHVNSGPWNLQIFS